MPVGSASIAHYMGCACVKPAMFFDNKPKDIQDNVPGHLLLTSAKGYADSDCCIELALHDEELNRLMPNGAGWYLYDSALPISRIRGIWFTNAEKMENTLANIELSTAFVPRRLFRFTREFESFTMPCLTPYRPNVDVARKVDLFDRILGAFMLMKTIGSGGYVPDAYFGLLGSICTRVRKEARAALGKSYNEQYKTLLSIDKRNSLALPVTDETVMKIAVQEGQTVQYDPLTRIIDIDKLQKQTYVYAILSTYGVGQEARRKKVDELILSGFRRGIRPDKSELVATYYGYNRGYSAFPKQYRSQDGRVAKDTKFRLDSLLDYYTVECVYRYVFFNGITDDCRHLEPWWPKRMQPVGSAKILDYAVRRYLPADVKPDYSGGFTAVVQNIVRKAMSEFDPMQSLYSMMLKVANDVVKEVRCTEIGTANSCGTAVETRKQLVERCLELNEMTTKELQYTAKSLGIKDANKLKKPDLVTAIFLAEGESSKLDL